MLAFRRRTNRTLLIAAAGFFLLSFVLLPLVGSPGGETSTDPGAIPGLDVVALARAAYTSPSILDLLFFQVFGAIAVFIGITFTQGPSVMALFLLGLLAGRLGVFERLPEHRSLAKRVLAIGIPVGLLGNSLFVFSGQSRLSDLGLAVGGPALAAVYVAGLSMLSLRLRGARLLAPLAKVGRMALTNYVLQSLICVLIFYGVGLGLYEQVGAAGLLGITVIVYLAQIPLSTWWLRRYQFGPLEWMWRSLTYRHRQPMRIVDGRPPTRLEPQSGDGTSTPDAPPSST